jgi:hypothetical protein
MQSALRPPDVGTRKESALLRAAELECAPIVAHLLRPLARAGCEGVKGERTAQADGDEVPALFEVADRCDGMRRDQGAVMYSVRYLISKLCCFDLNLTRSPIETIPTTSPPSTTGR